MDASGEGRHEREQVKNPDGKAKRQEKKVKKLRKIIRVESEETQDYAREAKKHGSGG